MKQYNTGLLFLTHSKQLLNYKKLNFFEYSKIVFGEKKEWIVLLGLFGFNTFFIF